MQNSRERLGELVKSMREHKKLSQDALSSALPGINRSNIAHLEQGLRLPRADILEQICIHLDIPKNYWMEFLDQDVQTRSDFEEQLAELCGRSVTLDRHETSTRLVADKAIKRLFDGTNSEFQLHNLFNSILVFYGVRPASQQFFKKYFKTNSFTSPTAFRNSVLIYQEDAVRMYSTFEDGYEKLNKATNIDQCLAAIDIKDIKGYSDRADWKIPNEIVDERLPDLGYISAARVKQENDERGTLSRFLKSLATAFREKDPSRAIADIPSKTKIRMDSLLRKFESHFQHGLFSSLFAPSADEIDLEADRLAPKSDDEIKQMGHTQMQALENLAFYLASDFLDVYVATSMRSDADFVSVNTFTEKLFFHSQVKDLKLRHFNPTQSWIDDRIAKGLVEALMLKRASVTIYMAQKTDTFGKDSEASVALGQGKPVIVYVPRLSFPDGSHDTESLFKKNRIELLGMLDDKERDSIDESVDQQAIFGYVLTALLVMLDDSELGQIAETHWADFDLYEEQSRIPENFRSKYRKWLDACKRGDHTSISIQDFRESIINAFVANAIIFERRARLFREIHPLALQVILSTGVLNGILVVRTVDQCATILSKLIKNNLSLEFIKDSANYRLIEKDTGSTVRVISRNRLLLNAFSMHYHQVNL
ncbi:transcriptional regulator, XRE family [Rhodoferax ferrireducens T118]|uniref:Transcriptional regulator, XRE family n=1 Tax=Albidiferax ferrireducens (strain ATCC BAA-621 / DSM 15236 / T118) TaxID=338969 RepID=Q21XF4_ALBFT|nr:helix-turn-helix transcriptional regulator [Rhodoferax ferrireducens]ABD69549.1 transcriptional regulator, XRE family [Rhodoferax ferrireducens T118]